MQSKWYNGTMEQRLICTYTQRHTHSLLLFELSEAREKKQVDQPASQPKEMNVIKYDEFLAIQRTRTIHLLRTVV